jgi:ATP-binding cassette subfamily F protein 3
MLRLTHLSLRRGARLLFSEANLTIHPGQRVGLTGANGSGKSSLFALILDEIHPDSGDFYRPKEWVTAHVAQETPTDDRPVIEYALDGDVELRQTEQALMQAEQAHQGERAAELHAKLETIGGYTARSRAAQLLHGLGFQPGEEELPVNQFSGGWRMRMNLARALMCRSDLLLLDEPTNHLDLDAVIWLEGWLKNYNGTLLLISHDREFLDTVTSHIAHIEQEKLALYSGNYSAFEHIRAERLANQQAVYEKQQREIAHIHKYVERFRAKATKARQAQSRIKALERMELIAPAHVDSPFHFDFKLPDKNPRPLLKLEKAGAGYGDKIILNNISLNISPGDRIGLLGPNGAGKSTMIKLLAGEIGPMDGMRHTAQDLKIGYFAQHQLDQLHPDHTPLEHLLQIDKTTTEQSLRNYLGGFGFSGDRAESPTAPFSGGEKARLVLALLVYQRPNLLLLDEPTNHLDIEMRHALSTALQEFVGAMVIVSHDRHLLRTCTDLLLLINNTKAEEFKGDLDDYPRWLLDNREQASDKDGTDKPQNEHSANARKDRKRQEAEKRRLLQPLRNKLKQLEQQMEQLATKQKQLELELARPEVYEDTNREKLKQLLAEKAATDRELSSTEEEWLTTEEELEKTAPEQG